MPHGGKSQADIGALAGLLGIADEYDSDKPDTEAVSAPSEPKAPFFQISRAGPNIFTDDPPVAFVPPDGFLEPDAQDAFIPPNSFIGDFVYHLKGYESPVIFNIWGAVFALSVMSGRQTSYKFGSETLYPNMYILWVAKPGVCKKGTALGLATKLLQELPDTIIDDPYLREEKNIDYITGKAPADAIFMTLAPKTRTFIMPDGTIHPAKFGSRAYVSAPELATFLNTKKFNTGMVDVLTDLYDCRERDREITRSRGLEAFENFFFCLGGCCTPMHLETSFPPEAKGGGFMSRCIMTHQEFPVVWHEEPIRYPGFPEKGDLLRAFRWIAYESRGEYYLTPEAKAVYKEWYMDWRRSLFERGVQDDALAETRMDIILLKLSTILRMAEYRRGKDITVDNFNLALRILNYTLAGSKQVASGLGTKEKRANYLKVRAIIQSRGTITRRQLLTRCSAKSIFVQELASILSQLSQEGMMIIELDGHGKSTPGTEGREIYTWTGPSHSDEVKKADKAMLAGEESDV